MIRRLAVLALLSSAVAACDSTTDVEVAARYALDVSPPVVLENDLARIEVLSDELRLNEDGTARRAVTQRIDYTSSALRDTTESWTEEYLYEVDGTTIEMGALCPPNALCAPPPHAWGRVTGDGLELHMLSHPDVVLTYRRLFP